MAKRIQMRKNRFLAIQKIAEKKLNVDGGPDGDHAPKQTVSTRPIRFYFYSKHYRDLYINQSIKTFHYL